MIKRTFCFALCFALLGSILAPIAFAEGAQARYYRLNVFDSPGAESGAPMDFMIIKDCVYVNAEQLSRYLGFEFMLNEENCSILKSESNTAYVFEFGKRNIQAYLVDHLVEYSSPSSTLYLDKVAWLPFSYTCALWGLSGHSRSDGLVLLKPEVSLIETLAIANSNKAYYSFDMLSEIGYADWAYAVTSITCTIVNFLDGLLDGTSFNALGMDMYAGIYNDTNVRMVADEFVKLTPEELEAYSTLYSQEVALASDLGLLEPIKEIINGIKIDSDGLSATDKLAQSAENVPDTQKAATLIDKIYDTSKNSTALTVVPQDIHPMVMTEATFGANYSKACKKYIDLFDTQKDTAKVASSGNTKKLLSNMDLGKNNVLKDVSLIDIASFTVNVYSYMDRLSNRDLTCMETLKKYSKDSNYRLAHPLYDYAASMNKNTEWYKAIYEYLEREGWSLVVDKVSALYNPIAIELFLYNMTKNFCPYIRSSFESMENHELARYASKYQNDSSQVASNAFYRCFSNDSITDQHLKDVSDYMFAFYKFSMTARNFAIESVDKCPEIDTKTKQTVISNMQAKNKEIAEYLVRLVQATEKNDTLVYGFLPSDSRMFLLTWKNDEGQICKFVETVGSFIEESTQETLPDDTIDLRDAISEEEAIELVKTTLSRGLMDILDEMMDGLLSETLSFTVIDTYRVRKDDESCSDCYVIAMASGGYTEENMFFVTLDGKDVWLGSPYKGEYLVLYQVDLLHFNPLDFVRLIAELEQGLIEETIKDH